jgi:hypothetical protein
LASKTSSATGTRSGWRHPRAVEAVVGLAALVGSYGLERRVVDLGVLAVRDEGRHAADRVRAVGVAALHQQLGVGAHERHGHLDLGAVRQLELRPAGPELLDHREDVVPAAGVQAGGVLAQLVEDLLHLEGRHDRLDQAGGADGAARDAERLLAGDEDVVPQPRLEVALHLGQVEVRPEALVDGDLAAGRQVHAEVEQAAGHRLAVDQDVPLGRCQPRLRTTRVATSSFSA